MRGPLALAAMLATVIVAVAAVLALREATMTVHHPVPPGSRLLVVVQAESNLDDERSVEVRAQALIELCQAEAADGARVTEISRHPGDRFTVTIEPSLDHPDQRQFQGCLQDLRLPHIQLRVMTMGEFGPGFEPRAGEDDDPRR